MERSTENKQINKSNLEQSLLTIQHTSFYFVRHGQTDWNVEEKLQGSIDIPLNETGKQQAAGAAKALAHLNFASICHSPLSRAKETALIIGAHHTASFHELDDLKERHFGSGEGKIKTADFNFAQSYPPEFFIDAEHHDNFLMRIIRGMNQALQLQGPVCIVSHGGVFGSLCRHLKIDPPRIANAAIVQFVPQEGAWKIVEINQVDAFKL